MRKPIQNSFFMLSMQPLGKLLNTDVFVLAIKRVPMFPEDAAFVAKGPKKHDISLRPIYDALGPKRAAALPRLHALSGADVTGSFSGKAKTSFWNKFVNAPDYTLDAQSITRNHC